MTDQNTKHLVQQQFGAVAERYVTSAIHAEGNDLARMVELAQPHGDEYMLDIATGGGHTALAFAPHVREVVASDLTERMLATAEAFIRGRGITNVRFERADAEALPFEAASFDIVTVRIAPHHFPNPAAFVYEVARVLKPGGRFIFDDNVAPEDDQLDAFINRVEQWRDPSHVRSLKLSEWRNLMASAGMTVEYAELIPRKRFEFRPWVERMNMPLVQQEALEAWMLAAPQPARDFFALEVEHGRLLAFSGDAAIVVARR